MTFTVPPWWVAIIATVIAAVIAAGVALLVPRWAATDSAPTGPPAVVQQDPPAVPLATIPEGPRGPFTVHEGDLVLTTPGEVVDGLDVRGFVRVEARDVTIRNSVIRGRPATGEAILIYAGTEASAGLRVIDTELAPSHATNLTHGVYGYGFTLTRVTIRQVVDAVHIFGDDVTIEGSHLHDHLHYERDPAHDGGPSHDDGIQVQQGRGIRIIGNTLSGAHNAAIQITQDRGLVAAVTITGNTISGGGCSINVAEKGAGPIRDLVIRDNVFGDSRHDCTMLIPPTTPAELAGNSSLGHDTVRVNRRAQ